MSCPALSLTACKYAELVFFKIAACSCLTCWLSVESTFQTVSAKISRISSLTILSSELLHV